MSSRRVRSFTSHVCYCYVIKPVDPKNASQVSHVKCLQAIYISLEQGPGFRTVQQYGENMRLVEAKLVDEAEISLSPHSTELIHGRRRERYTAHYLGRAVTISRDLAAFTLVNEFIHSLLC